jgi:hypothetical protein
LRFRCASAEWLARVETVRRDGVSATEPELRREAATLDRVHALLLLQAFGKSNALRSLLKTEQERSLDFLRLSNTPSAFYPKGIEERRKLKAMPK